jgi:hypothetical protein
VPNVLLVPSCCNKFGTSCWQLVTSLMTLSDLLQGCSNKSDTVRLTTQGCNNIVISWLYRTCWNNLVTSLILSTRLLQLVPNLSTTWDKQCEHNLLTAWWQTCYKMRDFYVCSSDDYLLLLVHSAHATLFASVHAQNKSSEFIFIVFIHSRLT